MVSVESRAPNGNIKTASDAIWYTYVTITTVGYGDTFPVTNLGRLIGMGIMTAGVALFGTLTGYLANAFLAPPKKKAPAAQPPRHYRSPAQCPVMPRCRGMHDGKRAPSQAGPRRDRWRRRP